MIGGLIGSILSPIITGGMALEGQRQTNRTNRQIATDASVYSDRMADKQMAFQERMANTQHQRARADLEAAGFNPLLGMTGAAAPGGASGSAHTTQVQNELERGIASALEARSMELAVNKQKEEVKNLKTHNKNIKADTRKKNMERKVMSKQLPKADVINDLYDIVKPYIKKGKESIQTSPRMIPKF